MDRILIVGYGSIGKRHLALAREKFPEATIYILRHNAAYGVPQNADGCLSNLEKAIDFKPEVAIVANPASLHVKIAQRLAESGAHLLIEKPISDSTTGVQELVDTCKKKSVVLLLGYNLRYLPSLLHFKSLLDKQIIGDVFSVRCDIGQNLVAWRTDVDYRNTVSAQKSLGGGALLELSHEIDYLRWIFGDVEWVMASVSQQSNLEIDVEDTAHLILGFNSIKREKTLVGTLNIDFIRQDTTRQCLAIGEKGSLKWDGIAGTVEVFERDSKRWKTVFNHQHLRNDSYNAEWEHFIACVSQQERPLVGGEDGLKVLQVIEAAKHSSENECKTKV